MNKIFVDDARKYPDEFAQYNCVRSYKQCVLLLSVYDEVDVLNLDYDLGTQETGLDILKYVYENKVNVKNIIIHSTHKEGVKKMEDYIQKYLTNVHYTYCAI